MPWHKAHVVAQRPEFFADSRNERGMIAARKIRAPDRALEQDVADKGEPGYGLEKYDVTWRMTRAMQYLKLQ